MNEPSFCFVAVAINRPLWQEFTYKVQISTPNNLIGSRALINFAGSKTIGIITKILNTQPNLSHIKTCAILDEGLIPSDVMSMIDFGSRYYHYPIGQCYLNALPKLLRDGKKCTYEEIPGLKLTEKGKTFDSNTLKSPKQKELLAYLHKQAFQRRQIREMGISSSCENALIKKGLIEKVDLKEKKYPWTLEKDILNEKPLEPNEQQQLAIDTISTCQKFRTFILNGITGSGKTEVYLQVIESVLKRGQAVLVLVPEIALTPQTFNRFYNRFKVPISSMHSQLSDRERLDAYIDMYQSNSAILIGTRTALFTPIKNLGLIILDEEHDNSFRQTDGFRYHAKVLAIIRAQLCNCPIILGSATPSLETIANYQKENYQLLNLSIRAGGAHSPKINIIDLKQEPLSYGLKAGICYSLENKIGEETVKGNQVLLFLNRRGYARNLICHNCGHIFSCPHCDNPLTVHKHDQSLKCHICEYITSLPKVCPKCHKNSALLETGYGTEQVEAFLRLRYPDVGIERIDRDTVKNKTELEEHLERFKNKKSLILLGTQMIAKGHDFPDVTLAGILDMDSCLFSDDFRSREECSQLLLQVSGRAGRAHKKGEVFIQTHYPDDELINKLITPNINYWEIAQYLLLEREQRQLPPSTFMSFLLANSLNRAKAHAFLIDLHSRLNKEVNNYANLKLSPVLSDKMEKRQNRYHFHILVNATDRKTLSNFLDMVTDIVNNMNLTSDTRFAIEVDPLMMY